MSIRKEAGEGGRAYSPTLNRGGGKGCNLGVQHRVPIWFFFKWVLTWGFNMGV